MNNLNRQICPKCKANLEEKARMYTRDLRSGSPIRETDVTGKTELELHSSSASGYVVGKMDKRKMEDFFNNTTGLSILEKQWICSKCGYKLE